MVDDDLLVGSLDTFDHGRDLSVIWCGCCELRLFLRREGKTLYLIAAVFRRLTSGAASFGYIPSLFDASAPHAHRY